MTDKRATDFMYITSGGFSFSRLYNSNDNNNKTEPPASRSRSKRESLEVMLSPLSVVGVVVVGSGGGVIILVQCTEGRILSKVPINLYSQCVWLRGIYGL